MARKRSAFQRDNDCACPRCGSARDYAVAWQRVLPSGMHVWLSVRDTSEGLRRFTGQGYPRPDARSAVRVWQRDVEEGKQKDAPVLLFNLGVVQVLRGRVAAGMDLLTTAVDAGSKDARRLFACWLRGGTLPDPAACSAGKKEDQGSRRRLWFCAPDPAIDHQLAHDLEHGLVTR